MNLRACSDSNERQRFTCAHELIHPAFPGFSRESRYRLDEQVGRNRVERSEEEYLCDFGAAELLMPSEIVESRYTVQRGLREVQRLGRDAEVSLEAAANRLVELSDGPAALRLLLRAQACRSGSAAAGRRCPGAAPASLLRRSRAEAVRATIQVGRRRIRVRESARRAWRRPCDRAAFGRLVGAGLRDRGEGVPARGASTCVRHRAPDDGLVGSRDVT